ncbi:MULTISPECIES: hypothetical protein [Paenibacillus]|uniref:hypothetical protein n=1 Tax=Paenibacillus TaxID=44249 RepID=UPI00096D3C4F|nr:hypothetical protein [Paenibacillus odorifer]OME13015.1 hypothetical protein BSK60_16160 [Paenibacillus odorifer]
MRTAVAGGTDSGSGGLDSRSETRSAAAEFGQPQRDTVSGSRVRTAAARYGLRQWSSVSGSETL